MDNKSEVSKMNSVCNELAKASYKCTESKPASQCQGKDTHSTLCADIHFNYLRVVCFMYMYSEFFDVYKECRRNEHKRIVDDRRNSYNSPSSKTT